MMEKNLLLTLVISTVVQCIHGGYFFSRRNFQDNPEEKLSFAIRALNAGMDLDKQAELDKNEMELRGLKTCEPGQCPHIQVQIEECKLGFLPEFDQPENSSCSCITGYQCCPETCKEAVNTCEKGKSVGIRQHDCCGCPTYQCIVCPTVDDTCPSECDEAVRYERKDGCPYYRCERRPYVPTGPEECSACHSLRHTTDSCGNQDTKCECSMTPEMVAAQCTPPELEPKDCYTVEKKYHSVYGCKSDKQTCQRCYHWAYEPKPQDFVEAECKPCEMAKVKATECGYKTVCQCRTFDNCFPNEPEPLACHKTRKVLSTDTSQCDDNQENGCKACYTWEYVPEELSINTTECDSRCMYKQPVSRECGSGEVCKCNGKDKAYCQPDEPQATECYKPVKVPTEDSFMCDSEEGGNCVQCWSWKFVAKGCEEEEKTKDLECSVCEMEEIVHTGCGCTRKQCNPKRLDNCRPPPPNPDECYTEARKEYTQKSYLGGQCIDCFYWNRTMKTPVPEFTCELKHLPSECFQIHHTTGTCNQRIENCVANELPCEETYGTKRDCPNGHKMVTLKSKCGNDRDACAECSKLINEESLPPRPYKSECYRDHELTIMDSCKQTISVKKPCNYLDDLTTMPCKEGMKPKLFFDDCDCPKMRCFGCPLTEQVDVQLLLDSSASIAENWKDLINEIKANFIGSIMTNPKSRMAIARFGEDLHIIAPLSTETSGKTLDDQTDFESMGSTHTAKALNELLPSFQQNINGSEAKKVLIVLSDGNANGGGDLPAAAKKWVDVVDEIHAMGFGEVSKAGLEAINGGAPGLVLKEANFEALEKAIIRQVVPKICGEPPVQL